MGQQTLIYSFVARGTVILAEFTKFTGNFTTIAAQCLQKLPASSNKFTYNCDGHTFNYLVEDGFTYCVVAVESAGRQIPIAFLERVKEDFIKKYAGGKAATTTANSLNQEFGPKLKEQMQYCVGHPEEISKLSKVKAQVSEVKGVMRENIEKQIMLKIKTPKTQRAARAIEKRAPKLVENGKKTLILHGTKTSSVLNDVLTQIYHLKRGNAVKYTKKNKEIRPFESGGETSLEFYSLKSDCSLFVFGSHSKKRPNNLVLGRLYDHHVYDLVEVGVENLKPMESFVYDKKLAPKIGSKPFFTFIGEGFESVEELKHLKEVLLDLFRGEVVENLNLAGVDHVYVCTAISPTTVFFTHCALRLKRSSTTIPRMELVEIGPSMDFVVRRHRLPIDSLKKEAMKTASQQSKKVKNVSRDVVQGKIGKIYMPDQQVGGMALSNDIKGLKRQRREVKMKNSTKEDQAKKRKTDS